MVVENISEEDKNMFRISNITYYANFLYWKNIFCYPNKLIANVALVDKNR